jgi:hypothetical protein
MRHVLTSAIAALVLGGGGTAQAQIYVEPDVYVAPLIATPPAVVVPPSAGYVRVGPRPSYNYGPPQAYSYGPQAPVVEEYVTVNPRTGRRCTIYPDGYRWCWSP